MSEIKVGDQVTWMHVSGTRTITMRTRMGTVESIEGNVATVKPIARSSNRVEVHLSRLRVEGVKSELSEVVEGVFKANKAKGQAK